MATGTIKRHDREPAPEITITTSSGSAKDLTNHQGRFVMAKKTTLSNAMDNSQLTIELPAAVVDLLVEDTVVLIDHERVEIDTPLPTQPIAGDSFTAACTRAEGVDAIAGELWASIPATTFVLSDDAVFTLSIDAETPVVCTVTAASTAGFTTIAELAGQVQTVIQAASSNVPTCTHENGRLKITSDTTGASSTVAITSPDAEAIAELGFLAGSSTGAAATTTTAAAHASGATAYIVLVESSAYIASPATAGVIGYEWQSGDTAKTAEFIMEFEVQSNTGKVFTVPNDESFTVLIADDFNDKAY